MERSYRHMATATTNSSNKGYWGFVCIDAIVSDSLKGGLGRPFADGGIGK